MTLDEVIIEEAYKRGHDPEHVRESLAFAKRLCIPSKSDELRHRELTRAEEIMVRVAFAATEGGKTGWTEKLIERN
jgi:hypothetical protein